MKISKPQTCKLALIVAAIFFMACKATTQQTTIPLIDSKTHHTVIPVSLNGHTYKFLWDSGTGLSYISQKAFMEIGADTINKYVQVTKFDSKVNQKCYYSDYIELGLGNIKLNVEFLIDADLEFDGIIGSNVINLYSWLFDFTNHEVTIFDKSQDIELNNHEYIYDFDIHYADQSTRVNPHIEIQLSDTISEIVCFDTGLAVSTLTNNEFSIYEDMKFHLSDSNDFNQFRQYIHNRYSRDTYDVMQPEGPIGVLIRGTTLNNYDPHVLFVNVDFHSFYGRNYWSVNSAFGLKGGVTVGSGFLKRFSRMYYNPFDNTVKLYINAQDITRYTEAKIDEFFLSTAK